MIPAEDMAGCRAAHERLRATLASLTDEQARRPSLLPGWTVAHVLSHLARNADSHVHLFAEAGRGQVGVQYPGGDQQRDRDIEVGSARTAADLVADVEASTQRLEEAWDATPPDVWRDGRAYTRAGPGLPLRELPFSRWREVEVHHADLGLAYRVDDWSEGFVDGELERRVALLAGRLPPGVAVRLEPSDGGTSVTVPEGSGDPAVVAAPRRRLVAWLLGRADVPGAPELRPWSP